MASDERRDVDVRCHVTNSYSGGTTLSADTLVTTSASGFGSCTVTVNDANTAASNASLLWSFVGTLNNNNNNNNIAIANQGMGTTTIGSVDGSTGA